MSTSYEEFLRRQEAGRTGIAAEASTTIGADEAARRIQYKRVYGVEPPDPAVQQARAARAEAEDAVARQPKVGSWLQASLSNIALARGMMSNMADVAETLQVPRKKKGTLEAARDFLAESMGRDNAEGGNYLRDYVAPTLDDISWKNTGYALAAGVPSIASAGAGALDAFITADNTIGAFRTQRMLADAAIMGLSDATTGTPQTSRTVLRAGAKEFDQYSDTLYSNVEADTTFGKAFNQGVRSLPMSATALVGGAAAGSATIAATLMGGLATGSSYNYGAEQGLDPQTALRYGVIDGLIEAGTEFIPFAKLLPGTSGSFLKNMVVGTFADLAGEQIATFTQDLNKFLTIDQPNGKTADQFWDERGPAAYDTAIASLVGSGSLAAASGAAQFAARKMGRKVTEAAQVESTGRFFDTLNRLAAANDVLRRDPKSFEEFVDHAAEGTDASEIFVEASELQTVLNQSDLTVEQVFEITGMTPEGLQQAVERGEDVSMTVGQYAARIATTPLSEQLLPHLRLSPDQMSRAQAETFLQGAQEEFAAEADAALSEGLQGAERQASRQRVEETILGQLNTTRRFTSDVNQTYASIVGAFFDAQSTKLGMTAEELAGRYGLNVQSGEVAQPTYDQPQGSTLNIGLEISQALGGGPLAIEDVRAALADMGIDISAEDIQQSDTEQTAVLGTDRALTEEELMALSERLQQDAVTQFADGKGSLIGPRAADWGDFDLNKFINLAAPTAKPKGDGRRFRDFFAGITSGESGAPDTVNAVRLFDTSSIADFESEYVQHMGKFDNHIGASIPGFREVQIAVGAALAKAMPQNGRMLDIAGSEGALAKAISAKRPDVETVVLDPNPAMRDTFANNSTVPGARFVMEAFTDTAAEQGQQLWDEDGVPILGYTPDGAFDVVHEAMGFQFIHNDRAVQIARVKQLMAENGIAIFEEKFVPGEGLTQAEWQQNEVVKDQFKLQYFTAQAIAQKQATILENKDEQATVGMNDLMVAPGAFEQVLTDQFAHAAQFWDSGNFKGYIASDSREAIDRFLAALVDTDTPFSTVDTPRTIGAETFNQSAVAIQQLPMGVEGTGPGGRVRNWDMGEALTLRHRAKYGRALDPSNPEDYAIALDAMVEDYEDQKSQPDSGEAWYSDDIADAIAITTRVLPELEDPVRRDIFLTAVALLSPQQGPVDNWNNAIVAMTGYSVEGRFAQRHPEGREFGVKSHSTGLALFEHLINQHGEIGALMWLNSEHTGAEMEAVRRASGLFLNKADNYLPAETNKKESKLGVYIFGPKVGDFMLNSTGMDHSAVTVDLWMARTYNRVIGRLTDVNAKQAAEGGLADAMRGRAERAMVKSLVRDAAEKAGITPSAMQAALWYFEQRLYRNHGIKSGSTSFSTAAREAALNRGIPVDGVVAQGSAARGSAPEGGNNAEGVRVYNQDPLTPAEARAGTVVLDESGQPLTVYHGTSANFDTFRTGGGALWFAEDPKLADGYADPRRRRKAQGGRVIPARIFVTNPLRVGEYTAEKFPNWTEDSAGWAMSQFGLDIKAFGWERVGSSNTHDITRSAAFADAARAAGYDAITIREGQGLTWGVLNTQSVQSAVTGTVLFQDAVFFSALERTLEKTATQKASAQQWEATLKKTPGIKAEELEWTGILDFLQMQEGPITRDALLEVVRGAGIRVDEVVLGGEGYLRNSPEHMDAVDMYGDDGPDLVEATQFSSWTTDPQNETYRELLITMPVGEGRNPNRAPSTHWDTDGVIAHARFMDKVDADGKKVLFIEEVQSDWHQKGRDQGYKQPVDPTAKAAAEAAYDEANAAEAELTAALGARMGEVWQTRFDKIEDAQQRADFAEAIPQPGSDWDYREVTRAAGMYRTDPEVERLLGLANGARLRTIEAGQANANLQGTTGIPDAPFRTGWPELVMKRMIRWAAERGYERIAWTTGEQQAARYNLDKHVGRVSLMTTEGAPPRFLAYDKQGNVIHDKDNATDADIIEAVGAEVAKKLIEQPKIERTPGMGVFWQNLEGLDLRVGGEGMKAFYDRNLVNITNKLVKKYGAKVGIAGVQNELDALSNEQPGFDITPELADAAMGGFPLFQRDRGPRGQIAFPTDITKDPSVITLLRGADLSTFMHELGHFFFEVQNHMANQAGAPPEIVADRDAMLKYLGVESATEWENRTPDQRREGHERVARSFEAYLFEGKAPSVELQGVFGKLRSWMLQVYRTITRLNVELTDEVRGVFDRMLASEEQIAEAQADAEMRPMFSEKPEGMSQSDWEEYQRLNTDATADAAKALESRSLRDMRYAGKAVARELKRLQREVKDQRDAMREEVVAEMSQLPVYRATTLFRTGVLDGIPLEGEVKLNTEVIREVLMLEDAPLPDAYRGMTKEGGLHPQQAAELLGYSSADHLLKDLLFASPLDEAVDAETDTRMRERYGELNTPEEVEQAAQAAVHNEVRGRFTATELAALQNAPGKKRVLAAAAKRIAQGTIAKLRIRDIRPGQYEVAERRAAKASRDAGTANLDEAVRQKRNQLLQFNLAKAAHEARDEVKAARDYLTKLDTKKSRANIDPDFMDQIDQLLESVELRQVSNRESDRRTGLAKWVEQMQAEGFEPAFDAEALARKPWRELTVEEMRGLRDAVRNIEHLGRLTKKLLTAKDKADLDTAANEMAESVRDNATRDIDPIVGAKTWWEHVKSNTADFFAMHRKLANLAYIFDGNKYGGVFWERFIRPMNEAGDNETRMLREANLRLASLFAPIMKENTTRREFVPEIGKSLSLEDRISVALNMGNEANMQRLMDGDKWTYEQVQAIIAPLQSHHWDFVENVWREIDSWWPQIAAKETRVAGMAPEKVEAQPFQVTLNGELRLISGGYFPIKYDADRNSKANADEAAEVLRQMTRGLYTNAQTRRGHTKARVDVVNRPLRKGFGVIFSHVNQVVHDLAWHEYLIDANRLLRHGAVDNAIRDHHGPEVLRWMGKALEDIAIGDIPAQNGFEKSIRYVRTGVSIASMGWSVWTSLLQPIGLTQSMSRIGAKHVLKGAGELLSNPAKMNEKIEWVYSVSPFMKDRGNTMQREINEVRNRIGAKSPLAKAVARVVPEELTGAVTGSFFYMMGKAQLMADLPTWLGQYSKSIDAGQDPDSAVAIADQAVIDSQSSGMLKDLAGAQRGSELMRLFTNFYSYFSATFNLMSDRTQQLRRVGAADLPYYMVDIMLLTVVPATITSLMYTALRTEDDEPEEWLANIAKDNASYMLGLMVGVREVGGAVAGMAGYQGPAGARIFAELGKLGKQVGQGEVDEAAVRAANSTAGILLHYPSAQMDRTVRGLMAAAEGEAGPQAVLVGPPVK